MVRYSSSLLSPVFVFFFFLVLSCFVVVVVVVVFFAVRVFGLHMRKSSQLKCLAYSRKNALNGME